MVVKGKGQKPAEQLPLEKPPSWQWDQGRVYRSHLHALFHHLSCPERLFTAEPAISGGHCSLD